MCVISAHGFKEKYETNDDFAFSCRLLAALAFLLIHHVEAGFKTLEDEQLLPVEAQSVIDYFEDNWLGRATRQGRC